MGIRDKYEYVTKYSDEVYSALTSSQTFSVRGALTAAQAYSTKEENVGSPYRAYNDTFSRFIFTIIKRENGEKIYKRGNIPVREIPEIAKLSEIAKGIDVFLSIPAIEQAFEKLDSIRRATDRNMSGIKTLYYYMKHKEVQNKAAGNHKNLSSEKAASVAFTFGPFKGKTPLQALKDAPTKETRDAIMKHAQLLEENLNKFPKNKEQIDAAKEAIALFDNNALNSEAAGGEAKGVLKGVIPIYKPSPRPDIRHSVNGYSPVYEIEINWNLGNNYPVEVKVTNYLAPVEKRQNGSINVKKQKMRDKVEHTFNLSSEQWFDCLYRMQMHMRRFEDDCRAKQFKDASTLIYEDSQAEKQQPDD